MQNQAQAGLKSFFFELSHEWLWEIFQAKLKSSETS